MKLVENPSVISISIFVLVILTAICVKFDSDSQLSSWNFHTNFYRVNVVVFFFEIKLSPYPEAETQQASILKKKTVCNVHFRKSIPYKMQSIGWDAIRVRGNVTAHVRIFLFKRFIFLLRFARDGRQDRNAVI